MPIVFGPPNDSNLNNTGHQHWVYTPANGRITYPIATPGSITDSARALQNRYLEQMSDDYKVNMINEQRALIEDLSQKLYTQAGAWQEGEEAGIAAAQAYMESMVAGVDSEYVFVVPSEYRQENPYHEEGDE